MTQREIRIGSKWRQRCDGCPAGCCASVYWVTGTTERDVTLKHGSQRKLVSRHTLSRNWIQEAPNADAA